MIGTVMALLALLLFILFLKTYAYEGERSGP